MDIDVEITMDKVDEMIIEDLIREGYTKEQAIELFKIAKKLAKAGD